MPFDIAITQPVLVVRGGGSTSSNNENTGGGGGVPVVQYKPRQIAGLVPLEFCDEVACRQLSDPYCCFNLQVFAVDGETKSTYENDTNTFLIDVGLYRANVGGVQVTWTLQKGVSGAGVNCVYDDIAPNMGNTYGTPLPFGTYTTHPSYNGYIVNWADVFSEHGRGRYRIKVTVVYGDVEWCMQSPGFDLREFDCSLADGSVKFENRLTGKIGSHLKDGQLMDLCDINHTDSIRLPGFFGFETVPEYLQVLNEYQNGFIQQVRNEAVSSFRFISRYYPKEYHDRLKIYAMMADELRVSDYNINNSDYNISQLLVRLAGNYEPVYQDGKRRRISKVELTFKAGVQNVIKSLCCGIK